MFSYNKRKDLIAFAKKFFPCFSYPLSLVVLSAVMWQQLTLLGKVAAIWKVYGKPTNTYEQFLTAFVADECRCSPLLPLQQAKELADAGWKVADHSKDEVVVSDVLSSSASDGEYSMKSFIVPVPKFPSDTKFPSDMKFPSDVLILKYILLFLRPQTRVFWHQKNV